MKNLKSKMNLENIASKIANTRGKVVGLSTTIMAGMPMIAQAGWGSGNADAESMVGNIAEVVVNIFPLIGLFFVISGVFKLIMAYRNDQPEAQTAAAKDIVIGAVFLAFRIFVWNLIKGAIGL